MSRTHIELNVITNKKTITPYTASENANADIAAIAEKTRNDISVLEELKYEAEKAEIKASINIMTGNTTAAKAYRTEKTRQGK